MIVLPHEAGMPIAPSFREVLRPTHELGRKVDEDPPAYPHPHRPGYTVESMRHNSIQGFGCHLETTVKQTNYRGLIVLVPCARLSPD